MKEIFLQIRREYLSFSDSEAGGIVKACTAFSAFVYFFLDLGWHIENLDYKIALFFSVITLVSIIGYSIENKITPKQAKICFAIIAASALFAAWRIGQ